MALQIITKDQAGSHNHKCLTNLWLSNLYFVASQKRTTAGISKGTSAGSSLQSISSFATNVPRSELPSCREFLPRNPILMKASRIARVQNKQHNVKGVPYTKQDVGKHHIKKLDLGLEPWVSHVALQDPRVHNTLRLLALGLTHTRRGKIPSPTLTVAIPRSGIVYSWEAHSRWFH